jgi:tripartite-type tricarboxylate transporter receptor subunit TctC
VVEKINAAARQIVQMPDVLERYTSLNLEPVSGTPEEFAQFIKADIQKYAEIVKRAGIPLQ